jgi:nitrate reductase NapE
MDAIKKAELRAFLFITIFLFPILAVAIVGGLGFAIWISQMLFGPPTV